MRTRGAYQQHLTAMISAMLFVSCSSCASTNRTKTLLLMGGAGLAGAGLGYSLTPDGERPEMHALYGGAVGALAAGVIGLFLFDEQKRAEELERQNSVMKKELDAFRDEGGAKEARLLYETSAPFGREIPIEYQGLVRPGRWSVYRLNQWVQQGEGTIIHQDRMVKLVPAQLTPAASSDFSEGMGPSVRPAKNARNESEETK